MVSTEEVTEEAFRRVDTKRVMKPFSPSPSEGTEEREDLIVKESVIHEREAPRYYPTEEVLRTATTTTTSEVR